MIFSPSMSVAFDSALFTRVLKLLTSKAKRPVIVVRLATSSVWHRDRDSHCHKTSSICSESECVIRFEALTWRWLALLWVWRTSWPCSCVDHLDSVILAVNTSLTIMIIHAPDGLKNITAQCVQLVYVHHARLTLCTDWNCCELLFIVFFYFRLYWLQLWLYKK